ncbi:hypothetical protein M135_1887 [Bacteroides fragilis str. S36L5]|nr:hypothetical protein M135_1887 [Bacteroides fragilis str. S36L5]
MPSTQFFLLFINFWIQMMLHYNFTADRAISYNIFYRNNSCMLLHIIPPQSYQVPAFPITE